MTNLVVAFERHPLLEAINLVGKVGPWRRTVPRFDSNGKQMPSKVIPGVVRLDIRPGEATLTCANFDMSLSTTIACRADDAGTLFLPLDSTGAAVEKIKAGAMIELHSDGTAVALLGGRLKVGTQAEPQDAPPQAQPVEGKARSVSVAMLREGLGSTNAATLDDPKRPYLGGVFIHDGSHGPAFVAMDGSRIHAKTAQGEAINAEAILPRAAGRLLMGLLPEEGTAEITVGNRGANFAWGRTVFRTRLIEGQFPSFGDQLAVCTSGADRILRGNADAILADLQLVTTVSNPKYQDFVLELGPDGAVASALFRSANGTDSGSVTLDAQFIGEPLSIGFQLRLVSDALDLFGEHLIEWRMSGPRSPTVISSPTMPGLEALVAPFMNPGAAARAQAA